MAVQLPKLTWTPSPNYEPRTSEIDLIVLHDCEGSFGGAINWFSQKLSQVSSHYVICEDGSEATKMVLESNAAWHARAFNQRSIGVELAGWAIRGFAENEWFAAANVVAFLLKEHGIPAQWSKNGSTPGFCRHFDLGAAGGGHLDPTQDGELWDRFVQRVKGILIADNLPATWPITSQGNGPSFKV